MRKRVLLTLVPTAGLLSLLWLSGSQSTALANSSTAEYTLTISPEPTRGTVRTQTEGAGTGTIECGSKGNKCSETFQVGNVTLVAEPDPGYIFARWEGDCADCGTNTTCTITLNADKICSATFTAMGDGGNGNGNGSGNGNGNGNGGNGNGGNGNGGNGGGTGEGGTGGGDTGGGTGGGETGSGTGGGETGGGGTGGGRTGGGGGGCSMTGSASSMAGLWNILVWLSVPVFALVRRIRKK